MTFSACATHKISLQFLTGSCKKDLYFGATLMEKELILGSDYGRKYTGFEIVVTTSNFNKTVKRNLERFPADFMFQLTADEFKNLKFHLINSGN